MLAVLASHGSDSPEQGLRAYIAGLKGISGDEPSSLPDTSNWIDALDGALKKLDSLRHPDKERLIRAMIDTVTADDRLVASELELMRAACASLHVPMPMIPEAAAEETPA